jgi:hypothetical protein
MCPVYKPLTLVYSLKSRVKGEAIVGRRSSWRLCCLMKGILCEADNPPLCCHTGDWWQDLNHRKMLRVQARISSRRARPNGPFPIYSTSLSVSICFIKDFECLAGCDDECTPQNWLRWGDLGMRNIGTSGNEGTWLHGFNP